MFKNELEEGLQRERVVHAVPGSGSVNVHDQAIVNGQGNLREVDK